VFISVVFERVTTHHIRAAGSIFTVRLRQGRAIHTVPLALKCSDLGLSYLDIRYSGNFKFGKLSGLFVYYLGLRLWWHDLHSSARFRYGGERWVLEDGAVSGSCDVQFMISGPYVFHEPFQKFVAHGHVSFPCLSHCHSRLTSTATLDRCTRWSLS